MHFNEEKLERAVIELFEAEQIPHFNGESIHKEMSEVLLHDDLKQFLLKQYSDQDITQNEIESIIRQLEKYNAFCIISDGVNNKAGSLFATIDFFYTWRKINPDDEPVDGINSLYTMVQGLFNKQRLLDVIRNFIFFPDTSNSSCRTWVSPGTKRRSLQRDI